MRSLASVGLSVWLLCVAGCSGRSDNRLPREVSRALKAQTTAVLYSLEPAERGEKEGFLHGFQILGETRLTGGALSSAVKEFERAVADWGGAMAACFEPRHALRVVDGTHTYDLVLCYECDQLYVYRDGKHLVSLGASGSPSVLNGLLAAAGVEVAKDDSEGEEARRQQYVEDEARWLAAMPKSIVPFRESVDPFGKPENMPRILEALAAEFPEPQQRILKLFAWFGSGAGPWSGYPSHEGLAEELLFDHPTAALVAAAESPTLTERQLEGAARFFGGWDFRQRRPDDLRALPPALRKRLLEHCLKRSGDEDRLARAKHAFGEPDPGKSP